MSAEAEIANEANAFAVKVAALTKDPYFREAVVKMSICEIAWALVDSFPDNHETICEQLDGMADVIRSAERSTSKEADAS